jgi:hypothetical protein
LTRLVRRYDKDVNGSWSFREFLTFVQPLTQYSLKAKDLNTGLVLGGADPLKVGSGGDDKVQFAETSSTSSLGELNALLKKKHGRGGLKDNKRAGSAAGPALSKASKSTAAMPSSVTSSCSLLFTGYSGSVEAAAAADMVVARAAPSLKHSTTASMPGRKPRPGPRGSPNDAAKCT